MKKYIIRNLVNNGTLLLVTALQAPLIYAAPDLSIQEFTKATGLNPGRGAQLERTVVAGIYAFRYPTQRPGQCAQFVTSDFRLIANQGIKGWVHLKDRSPLTLDERRDISQRMVDAVSGKLIPVGPESKKPEVILISAVDCPYCIKLESKLMAQNVAYLVVPGALDPANQAVAEAAWQSNDAGAAWAKVMAGRGGVSQTLGKNLKRYPQTEFEDIRCMAGSGTPRAIFPDGRNVFGVEAILAAITARN